MDAGYDVVLDRFRAFEVGIVVSGFAAGWIDYFFNEQAAVGVAGGFESLERVERLIVGEFSLIDEGMEGEAAFEEGVGEVDGKGGVEG